MLYLIVLQCYILKNGNWQLVTGCQLPESSSQLQAAIRAFS